MKLLFRTLLVALAAIAITSTAFGQADRAGSKDYPGITRMPGFYIESYSEIQFDSATFTVDRNGKKTPQAIKGRTIKIQYYRKRDTPAVSNLQIVRNLQYAARAAGGQVMDDSPGTGWYNTTLRLTKDGKEVHPPRAPRRPHPFSIREGASPTPAAWPSTASTSTPPRATSSPIPSRPSTRSPSCSLTTPR